MGQDLGQQLLARGQAQNRLAGVVDQPGGYDQESVAQGAQMCPAAAVAVVEAGQFLQPRGQVDRQQRAPHPHRVCDTRSHSASELAEWRPAMSVA